MIAALARRILTEAHPRLLARFAWNLGFKGMRTMVMFHRRLRRGEFFPAFLFISITSRCNLRCRGCWVTADGPERSLSSQQLDRIIRSAKSKGSFFFGILGGEPLLHPGLFDVLGRHRDCYFQVFTNAHIWKQQTPFRYMDNPIRDDPIWV